MPTPSPNPGPQPLPSNRTLERVFTVLAILLGLYAFFTFAPYLLGLLMLALVVAIPLAAIAGALWLVYKAFSNQ